MTTGGFFGDFDIAGAADDPFSIPDGTYKGVLTDFDGDIGGSRQDGSPYRGMQFTFKVSEGDQEGGTYDEYFPLPTENTPARTAGIQRSRIKGFLASLEVPSSRMNSVDPNDLLGLDVVFTVETTTSKKNGKKYRNATFRLANGSAPGRSGGNVTADLTVAPVSDSEFGL